MRKLRTIEMQRLSVDDFHSASKLPLVVVLDDVRSMYNVGSVFRTCDAFRITAIYLCGITATPPHNEIHKTALGAENSVDWAYFPTATAAVERLKAEGFRTLAVEQAEGSTPLQHAFTEPISSCTPHHSPLPAHASSPVAVVFGNEVKGVGQQVIDICDGCVEIPQFGTKHSMNVAVSVGMVLWEIVKNNIHHLQFPWCSSPSRLRQWGAQARVLAIDADDTLWDCQSHFDEMEQWYCRYLSRYGTKDVISSELFAVERGNMPELGYGSKAVIISLVENALRVSGGKVSADDIGAIIERGRRLLHLPATPLPGVLHTLQYLRRNGNYRMVLFTKGDILEQQQKLHRSGLRTYFDDVVIVADKHREEYSRLCGRYGVSPRELIMVGNSFKSDIQPAIAAGCRAIYIPYYLTWKYEEATPFEHEDIIVLKQFSEFAGLIADATEPPALCSCRQQPCTQQNRN